MKVKSAGSSSDVVLVTENSASTTAWKRASTSFDVTGGDPNSTTLPITLLFDSSDARDSYGAYIDNVILLPVDLGCPTVYMFCGHSDDVITLCKVDSAMSCVWKLKTASPAIGTFDYPDKLACSFTATAPGKNTIQLEIGNEVVWEKPIEVLPVQPRSAWGAESPVIAMLEGMPSVNAITVHHSSASSYGIAEIKRIQDEHMGKGIYALTHEAWADIGYQFVLDPRTTTDDTIVDFYEARQLEGAGLAGGPFTKGSAVKLKNTAAGISVCVLGNYDLDGLLTVADIFTEDKKKNLEKVLTALCRRYKVDSSKITYHQDLAQQQPRSEDTICPGTRIIVQMRQLIEEAKKNLK